MLSWPAGKIMAFNMRRRRNAGDIRRVLPAG